jgi:hypothetical protein
MPTPQEIFQITDFKLLQTAQIKANQIKANQIKANQIKAKFVPSFFPHDYTHQNALSLLWCWLRLGSAA